METILAFCLGITLSAACGFRIFVPPLAMSIGAIYGDLSLAPGWEWVGTYPALIVFTVATATEVLAYYFPFVDNFLDTIEIPTAVAVGTMLTAANLGELDPVWRYSLALLVGGGTAGIIETFTSATRLASTSLTGGMGNPLVSTTEVMSATTLSILALTLPLLAAGVVLVVLVLAGKKPLP